MKHHSYSNRGQVLIIFVFAVVGLIGITGLAIDGGNIFSDRRHAQNAADTASLTAALLRNQYQKDHPTQPTCSNFSSETPASNPTCAAAIITRAMDIAAANGYASNQVNDRVDVYSPPRDAPFNDCSQFAFNCHDYIQVKIHTNVNTWFAKILGIGQLHNNVAAVALSKWTPRRQLYGGNSLVELRPTSGPGCGMDPGLPLGGGGGDVYLGGNSGLILRGGGLFVNSNNLDCALKIRDSGTPPCSSIQLLGGAGITGLGGEDSFCTPQLMQPATEGYPYPPTSSPVSPIPPAECNIAPPLTGWDPEFGVTLYYPGHYPKLPPERDARLAPGVYCVDDLIKTTSNYKFYADGAFMYVKPGGNFNFNGGLIQLVAPGMTFPNHASPQPVSDSAKPYQGYLIYVDADNWTGSAPNCIVNASSNTVLKGVIYAPHCDVVIDGNSGTIGLTAQVIAYTLSLTGGATLDFTYDGNIMPGEPEKMLMSLSR